MTPETEPQIKEFQAETKQVLRLVIHSLYSHKEIFLRELISNASDACEKLRFEALAKPELMGTDTLSITLIAGRAARTLSIKDNGIGMSEEEVIDNLGTIARSGTKKFLETLSGDAAKDAQLIGQFGVGFYSAFIVADKVTVLTKRGDAPAVRWDSDGEGRTRSKRRQDGSRHRSDSAPARGGQGISRGRRLRQLVRKYSDHLSMPIVLKTGETEETLNQAKAFWTRPKAELKDEDYQAFYNTSLTIPRMRALGRTTRSKAISNTPRCCTCRSVRRSICSSASRRAACSCTSSASSSWTRRRNCCRHSCASCADWSTRPICR